VMEEFEAVALGAPRRQRQRRVFAILHLDRRLLVNTKHGSVLGRVQVQPDHVGRLGLEVRVVASDVALEPMRLVMPCLAQMRVIVICEISPSSAASLREDQCVDPSAALRFVVHASTRASI